METSVEMESFYCIFCTEDVTSRQEAQLCDGRNRWQHRRCQTGITRDQYRAAVRSGKEVIWHCLICGDSSIENSLPVAESTRLETDDFDIPASSEISFPLPSTPNASTSENQETGITTLLFLIRRDS